MLHFIQCFLYSLQWYFITGNWERKDFGFCHSYHRTASEKRRKAEEDASEAKIVFIQHLFSSCIFRSRLGWTKGSMLLSMRCGVFLQVGALVITPTRELALQISEVMEHFIQKFPQFT